MSDEKRLHSTMMARDMTSGATKGTAAGALLGLAGKHPKSGAAAGALLGSTMGYLKGRERVLKDTVKEQRMDERYARRHAGRLKAAQVDALFDELEKIAVSEKWIFEKTMSGARKNPEKAARRAWELSGQGGERSAKRIAHFRGLMAGQQHRAPPEKVDHMVIKRSPKEYLAMAGLGAAAGGVGGYHLSGALRGDKGGKKKHAFLAPLATTVGTKAMQYGTRAAKALGQGDNFRSMLRKGVQAQGANLSRNVGYGVMGAGALGAAGAAHSMMGGGQQ